MSVLSRLTGIHINLSGRPKAPTGFTPEQLQGIPTYPGGTAPTAATMSLTAPRINLGGVTPLGIGTGGSAAAPTLGGSAFNPGGTGTAVSSPTGIQNANGGIDWGKILGYALKVAPVALGAYGAYQGAQQSARGQALQDDALAYAKARDAELAPLRTAGIQGVLSAYQHPVSPLDAVGGYVDSGNPYSRTPQGAPPAPAGSGAGLPPGASPATRAAFDPNLGSTAPGGSVSRLGGALPLLTPAEIAAMRARGIF